MKHLNKSASWDLVGYTTFKIFKCIKEIFLKIK